MGYIAIDADAFNSLMIAGMAENSANPAVSASKYVDALLSHTRSSGHTLVVTDQIVYETTKDITFPKDSLAKGWYAHPDNQRGLHKPATETRRKLQRGEPVEDPGEESIMDFQSDIGEAVTVISDDKTFWDEKNATWHSTQGILATLVRSGYIAKDDAVAAIKRLNGNNRAKTISPCDALDIFAEPDAPDAACALVPQPQE